MPNLLNAYLLAKPSLRGWLEWSVLCSCGILGLALKGARIPWVPFSNAAGAILFLAGLFFHIYCERYHREAHKPSRLITQIIDRGVYMKIRHPLYLSLIIMDFGIALAFGVLWTLIPAVLFSVLAVITALKEEEFLLERFAEEYGAYKKKIPWRMVPYVF